MLSDERLNALIRGAELDLHDAERNQEHQERIEWYRDVLTALRHYQSLRRCDAVIEKAMKQEPGSFLSVEPVANVRTMASIYSESGDTLHEAEGQSVSEALSALAAGLEGESND